MAIPIQRRGVYLLFDDDSRFEFFAKVGISANVVPPYESLVTVEPTALSPYEHLISVRREL